MNGATAAGILQGLTAVLLAEAEAYRHMGKRFRPGDASIELADVVMGAVLVLGPLALILLHFGLQRIRNKAQSSSPRALFFELCQAHQLDWRTRWVLWRTARRLQIDPPAMIFLDPATWKRLETRIVDRELDFEALRRAAPNVEGA